MKIILLFLMFFIGIIKINSQIKTPVHLSFNYTGDKNEIKKHINNKGGIVFFINNERFVSKQKQNSPIILKCEDIKDIEIIDIDAFLSLAWKERKRLIEEEKEKGAVRILTNDKIFFKIYLYEKKDNLVYRYELIWEEEIK